MQTWEWTVDVGASAEPELSVKTTRFGNGLEQSVEDGFNSVREIWTISKFGEAVDVLPAYQFLKAHKGARAFEWVTPIGETIFVKGRNFKIASEGGTAYTLTATFEQVFQP